MGEQVRSGQDGAAAAVGATKEKKTVVGQGLARARGVSGRGGVLLDRATRATTVFRAGVAAAVTGSLVVSVLVVPAASAGPDCSAVPDEPSAAAELAQDCGRDLEVTSARTPWQTVTARKDGTVEVTSTVAASRTAVHGTWSAVDTRIETSAGEDTRLDVRAPVWPISFASGPDPPLAVIGRDAHQMVLDSPLDLTTPVVDGDAVTYPEVLPGVDLVVTVNEDGTGVRQVLRVESAEAALDPRLQRLSYPVTASDGLDVRASAGGGFVVADEWGNPYFTSPAVSMWDSRGDEAIEATAEATVTPFAAGEGSAFSSPSQRSLFARPLVTDDPIEAAFGIDVPAGDMAAALDAAALQRTEEPVTGDAVSVLESVISPAPAPATGAPDVQVARDATVSFSPDADLLTSADTRWPVYIDPQISASPSSWMVAHSGTPDSTSGFMYSGTQGVGVCDVALVAACKTSKVVFRLGWQFGGLDAIGDLDEAEVDSATFNVFGGHSYDCNVREVQLWSIDPYGETTQWAGFAQLFRSHLSSQTVAHKPACASQKDRWISFDATKAAKALANTGGSVMSLGLRSANETDMTLSWKRYRGSDASVTVVYTPRPVPTADDSLASRAEHRDAVAGTVDVETPVNAATEQPAGLPAPVPMPGVVPRAALPGGGSATVAVQAPPSAFARSATVEPPVVGGLPMSVTPVAGQEALAPAEVQVDVKPQGAAESLGVTGVLLDLTAMAPSADAPLARTTAQADGVGAPVHVELSYADFANAAGGDWASRLGLWRLPECYATTPDLAECRPERVASENDVQARVISADLVLPAAAPAQTVPLADGGQTARAATATATATSGGGASYALSAGTSSPSGSWGATSLSPSSTWQVSPQTGDFSWSYPMEVPPAPGGLEPELALSYSSGSVDGRTSGQNNQSSWVGDGWDLWSGYIERTYLGCSEDDSPGANSADMTSSDLCWVGDHLSLVFSGGSGKLVKDTAATASAGHDVWRLESDDGTKVERLTGAANGVRDGEHWVVTTTDGTRYTFGKEDAGQASAWGVPVYGNHPGDPCYQAQFKDSICASGGKPVNTGWRWNLDRVEDVHGNTLTYLYTPEVNFYSRVTWDADTAYERGGVLKEILYGTRAGDSPSSAPLKVGFTTAERCVPGGGFACDPADRKPANSSKWPDVPLDLICEKVGCPGVWSPAFFSTKRLVGVATSVRETSGAAWRPVDSWTLDHTFPNTGDGTDPVLWLAGITHAGRAAAAATSGDENKDGKVDNAVLTLDPIRFDGIQLANRWVAPGDRSPVMNRWRIGKVVSESGGVIDVTYSAPDCTAQHPTPADNRSRCFPAFWSPEGSGTPRIEWFNKYVVTTLRADGRTERSAPITTSYDYDESTAAWAWDDTPLTKEKHRTWGVWRGYGTVDVYSGDVDSNDVSAAERFHTRYLYFQGLHEDRTASGGTRGTMVDGIKDHEQFAGMIRRQTVFSGGSTDADRVGWTITTPIRTATVSAGGVTAYRTGVAETTSHKTRTGEDGTGVRVTRERTEYDSYGMPAKSHDDGDVSTSADDRCTTTTYARNTAVNILEPVAEEITVAGPCVTPADAAHVIGWTRVAYDGHSHGTGAPTRALPSATQQLRGFDAGGSAQFLTTSTSTYDVYGRLHTVTDTLGRSTTTTYNDRDGDRVLDPDEYGVVTQTATIDPDPDGAGPLSLVTTHTVDPAWGAVTRETDPNGRVVRGAFDTLGRLVAVWGPDRDGKSPSVRYRYVMRKDGPNGVVTSSLGWDGATYTDSVELYDGLLRERQTLTPSADRTTAGTIVTDRFYDSRGMVYRVNDPWFTPERIPAQASSLKLLLPQGENAPTDMAVPGRTQLTYDGAGRQTSATWQWREGAAAPDSPKIEWTTRTVHGGDRVTVVPPFDTNATDGIDPAKSGGTPTTSIADARGQTVELRQHLAADAKGEYVSSRYEYDKAGRLTSVKDAQGTTWSYRYDALGRQVCADDPDKGVTTSVYDDAGQVVSTTDARGLTSWSTLDVLGRRTALHETSGTAVPASCGSYQVPSTAPARPAGAVERSTWVYDTLLVGLATSSTRVLDGARYTTAVAGYDVAYRPLGQTVTVPASVLGGAAGATSSFTTDYSYTAGGYPETVTLPAAGGLEAEEVTTRYDERGMPEWMGSGFGWGAYVADARYTAFGEKSVLDLGNTFGTVVSYEYQQATHRLVRIGLDRERVNGTELDVRYGYDVAGNILSAKDDPTAAGTADDNQCFTYDALRRLTSAWTPSTGSCSAAPSTRALGGPAAYWTDYAYDTVGNRTSMTSHRASGDVTAAYTYGPSTADPDAGVHALTGVETTTAGGASTTASYVYDAAGNTVNRPFGTGTQVLGWDGEGRLAQVVTSGTAGAGENQLTAGEASFVYTADGERLVRKDASGTTLYLPGGQELTHYTAGSATGSTTATRYYGFGGQTVAVRDGRGLGGVSSLVNDVHGTALAVVHNTKYTLTRNFADPFGGRRGEVLDTPGDRGFLGKVEDTTGLTSVGARYYDSGVGRFVSVDPVMDLGDPQQWSAYTYANNNPVTWSDPTGLLSWKGAWSSVKKGASAVGKWASKNKAEIIGGVVGTVVGVGCAALTVGWGSVACAVAGGALAGAITNTIRQSSSGKPFSWKSLAVETAFGGAGGLLGFGIGAAASRWIAPVANRAVQGAVSAVRASTSRGGQAVASSARGTVSQARNSAAQVAGTKPIPANKPKPPTAPSGTSNARPTAPVKNPQTAHTKGQTTGQCSFAGATPVLMANGEHKAIEDIEVGDQVIATDPLTAVQAAMPVTHVWVHEDDLFEFEVNGELIVTTEDHPFWSVTDRTWEGTQSLGRGELVLGADGNVLPVTRPVDLRAHERASAYNLTVAGAHSYHVGLNEVLVHNSGRPGPEDAYLWRAVTGAELSDISSTRQWHSPQGVKYFAFSEASAAEYARRAYSAYPHEGAYTMIRTTVRMSDLPDDARMAYTTDVKGGGVALSNDQLKVLGRPSIMPGGIQGAGVC